MTQDEIASRELLEKALYFIEGECPNAHGADSLIDEMRDFLSSEPSSTIDRSKDKVDLHDWYAGMAMQALIKTWADDDWAGDINLSALAADYFGLADENDVTKIERLATVANYLAKQMVHLSLVRKHEAKRHSQGIKPTSADNSPCPVPSAR